MTQIWRTIGRTDSKGHKFLKTVNDNGFARHLFSAANSNASSLYSLFDLAPALTSGRARGNPGFSICREPADPAFRSVARDGLGPF